ncbi:putative RiPP precursor [Mesorhizobium sp. ES1-1]|nr:putative RiPP precursor [Mesorhizobium sp. ES1-1]MBZ9678650.1 putative RiPP precursor [Mesorhizobium sp. ES1-1]
MKKTYAKPLLLKKGQLSAVTAANGASNPLPD